MSNEYFPIYLQYHNSPKLKSLVTKTANALLFQGVDFTADYLSILTATTAGLDNWGVILNQTRSVLAGTMYDGVFGFDDGEVPTDTTSYPQNFFNSNFYNVNYSPTEDLNNTRYRALLSMLYRKYTTNNSIYDLNNIIKQYATIIGIGTAYCYSTYNMSVTYHFSYALQPYEYYLFNQKQLLPSPAGVQYTVVTA